MTYAPAYTVVLYGDDKKITEFTNVKTTFLDLSKAMSDLRKTYYYEVKATPSTDEEKQYMKDGEFVTASTEELQEPEGSNPVSASENEKSIDDALLDFGGEAAAVADDFEPHAFFVHLDDFLLQGNEKQPHQKRDFIGGSAPVFGRKGEDGEIAHACVVADVANVFQHV